MRYVHASTHAHVHERTAGGVLAGRGTGSARERSRSTGRVAPGRACVHQPAFAKLVALQFRQLQGVPRASADCPFRSVSGPASGRSPAPGGAVRAGSAAVDAGLRALQQDGDAAVRSGAVGQRHGHVERGRQDVRLREDRQALPLRHRRPPVVRGRRRSGACRPRRAWWARRRWRTRTGPAVLVRRFSRQDASRAVQRVDAQSPPHRSGDQNRHADHDRRQPGQADQERHRELGVRGGARSDHRHVVVARRPEARFLPVRRERRSRLFPAARSDQDSERDGHRSLSEGRRSQSGRGSARLRRRDQEGGEGRPAQRQALRQLGDRPLRLPRGLVPRWQGTAVQSHQSPSEHPGARRREPGYRRHPRDHPRGLVHGLDREHAPDGVPQGWPAVHLGVRTERLEEPVPLRSQRHAAAPADDAYELRDRVVDQGGRTGRGRVLYRPRWRQPSEAAAASRRPGRERGRQADRSEIPPHHWQLYDNV